MILEAQRGFETSPGSKCFPLVDFDRVPFQVSNNKISYILFSRSLPMNLKLWVFPDTKSKEGYRFGIPWDLEYDFVPIFDKIHERQISENKTLFSLFSVSHLHSLSSGEVFIKVKRT